MDIEWLRTYLADPAWWFSVVLVGVAVSTIAGFIKDGVETAIGKASGRVRARVEARRRRRSDYVRSLSDDSSILSMEWARAAIVVAMYVGTTVMFLLLPSICAPPTPSQDGTPVARVLIALAFHVLFFVLSTVLALKSSSRVALLAEATKLLRSRRGIPSY